MFISATTLDDLLAKVFARLLRGGAQISPTKGPARELTGVLLRIRNPRARLSRTDKRGILFSCLGELLWYLSGTNDLKFIEYYLPDYGQFSDDNKTVHGGYGPRIFGTGQSGQIKRIISLLKKKTDSRQAVVQIFHARDIVGDFKDVPCTCSLQFMIRRGRLHMLTSMRSNDAYLGLPHDVFSFTMIQEIVARALGVELGEYKHFVGSLHLYDTDRAHAQSYLEEGWQSHVPMPPAPSGDPWSSIEVLMHAERQLRTRKWRHVDVTGMDPYWADLCRILEIFALGKNDEGLKIAPVMGRMASAVYAPYLRKRLEKSTVHREQLEIFALEPDIKATQRGSKK